MTKLKFKVKEGMGQRGGLEAGKKVGIEAPERRE
jgi:hypothetical protein